MKYMLRFFEVLWGLAILCSLGVALYHLFSGQGLLSHLVYFPVICAVLSTVVLFNIRSQRKFTERHLKQKAEERNA